VDRSRYEVVAVDLAAVVRKEEALLDSQASHARQKRRSDVLSALLPSEAHLVHSFVVGYSREDRRVSVDARRREEHSEDAMQEGRALDLRMEGKPCVHMVMQYSAKRVAAVVVFGLLDP
jgi:hypothetical protein